jgi:hypothetical protein
VGVEVEGAEGGGVVEVVEAVEVVEGVEVVEVVEVAEVVEGVEVEGVVTYRLQVNHPSVMFHQ